MTIFNELYDETIDLLDHDCCTVFVPVVGGLYRAVFAPADSHVKSKMVNNPLRFAATAVIKTREFAESRGYLLEDY